VLQPQQGFHSFCEAVVRVMELTHHYRVITWWTSGRTGIAKSDSAPNALHFTAPPEFGGLEGRWTPEDLLLTAVASCYTTTFRALADYSKFDYADLEVEVGGRAKRSNRATPSPRSGHVLL